MNYSKAIKLLNKEGYAVLKARLFDDGLSFYMLCYKFTESTSNNVESIDYCVCEGIDITEFLTINSANPNIVNFKSNLAAFIESEPVITVQFSKNTVWSKWHANKFKQ